ncbi:metal ABC transporter ATP-binding protein [Sulfurimonas sp. HSL3-7]|uniref:metal ABC transporter ATP-binding protein n=1 Tax=Sulfonitrofixus jiaomeiensis TaxID=3131938 RepID=UPI0031F7DAFB
MKFTPPVFEVKNLFYQANGQKILQNIALSVLPGDYCAIIGPNGGGKTTLIRLLLGLETPTQGEIKLFGQDLGRFKRWDKIGYVPQRAAQLDQNFPATVLEVVKMGCISKQGLFKRMRPEDKVAVHEAMVKMDVLDIQDKLIGELSGGQRQRVMIARALASKPEVLILDEPNTGVDVVSQQRFYKLLRELNRQENMTIIFITHDIGVIVDDIGRLFTINQTLLTCNNPKEAISCEDMSKLYGIDAHLIHNHHHH